MNGWLLVDKPAGLTSSAVVNKVKWVLDAQKAGHAGTLDPDATGLLAIALGEATKTIPYVCDALKAYYFTVQFGSATDSDDASGQVIARSNMRPDDAQIIAILNEFIGHIKQVPPQFSAVKLNGQRAYDLARDGQSLDLRARDLYVQRLSLLERLDVDHASFELICGRGGYVRSIARDLGVRLNCYAHVRHLRRVWSGSFAVENALSWSQVNLPNKIPALESALLPVSVGLQDVIKLDCEAQSVHAIKNGNPVPVDSAQVSNGDAVWMAYNDVPMAIGIYRDGIFHPNRVFVGLDDYSHD